MELSPGPGPCPDPPLLLSGWVWGLHVAWHRPQTTRAQGLQCRGDPATQMEMPEAGVQAALRGGSRSTAQSLPCHFVSQDWPLRVLVPLHGGRACRYPGAVLGGSAVRGSDMHSTDADPARTPAPDGGNRGSVPRWGGRVWITGGQGALWFSRNKILLRGSTTCGLESGTVSRLCLQGLETPSCSCASTCRDAGVSGRGEGARRRAL